MLLRRFLEQIIHMGQLTVIDADGRTHRIGPGGEPAVTVRLHDRALHWKLFVRPELYVGEAYTDGTLTVEDASIYDFLEFMGRNFETISGDPLSRIASRIDRLFQRLQQFNPADRARRNAAHHYDLSGALYDLFLDADRQYSCAYFSSPRDTLEEAQQQKRRHIGAKLLLQPGMEVLDIGSGWGGLGLWLAGRLGASVTGITLAEEQLEVSRARAAQRGLAERAQFFLRDYRQETGVYDRIVSVGMFEHVGVRHYDDFFGCVRDRLVDDGVALLHTIGHMEGPGASTNPWIRKYIFPGGYTPALSEIVSAIERARLYLTDVEIWRLHYAETLRHWRERFLANRERAKQIYDERFCRMWEFYLAGCEMSFRYRGLVVFQIQMAKRIDMVPLSRDYIVEAERALAEMERQDSEQAA
jgi:cyclopropane-fatty-acyl-phospholipid synthase